MTTPTLIPFHGHNLITVQDGDIVRVAMKPITDAIGLQWEAQHKRIQRHPVLSSTMSMMDIVARDGKKRQVLTLPLEMLNGWLFGVDVNRVKPEIRDTLLMYQRECFHVLFSYWHKGEAINPRFTTVDERTGLRDAVNLLVSKRGLLYPDAYRLIHQRFSVEHLDELTHDQLPQAIEYVHRLVLEGDFIAAPADPDALILGRQDQQHLFQILSHLHWIHKVWHEGRIGTALKMLGSPAPIRMRDHLFVANLHRRELVKRHGGALHAMRQRAECAGTRLTL